jgi:NTE family protein
MQRLAAAGERFDLIAGASSGSICGAIVAAGLSMEGPAMWRSMANTPVVSTRWIASERSIFGMSAILRMALDRFLPEQLLCSADTELLVATTHARTFARGLFPKREGLQAVQGLVVHSSRDRRDMHDVIVASCYIPIIYARVPRLDGDVHVDGGASDNTLIDVLVARGATDITVVTPYMQGAVSRTMFSPEIPPKAPSNVRLRLLSPVRPLSQKRFDFAPGPMEEALTMPHVETIVMGSLATASEGDADGLKRSA